MDLQGRKGYGPLVFLFDPRLAEHEVLRGEVLSPVMQTDACHECLASTRIGQAGVI